MFDVTPFLSKRLRFLGPAFWKPLFWCCKRASRSLAKPWYQLRREIGLPDTSEGNPLSDSHSPLLVLALFSEQFAPRQPDWPDNTVTTGFPFLDDHSPGELPKPLARFLEEGPPPIVFTHGSAASADAVPFFEQSIAAAKLLNHRAVIVLGRDRQTSVAALPDHLLAVEYAPFAQLFPRAAVNVHHGGVGTTALALRSGKPMLIVPNAWDQFDNAQRTVRLGVARSIPKHRYQAKRVAAEIDRLLEDKACAQRAAQIGELVRRENGVEFACDAIENLLQQLQSGQ